MGLDMFLHARKFYFFNEEAPTIAGVPDGYKVQAIEVQAAYWRKSNQIHKWFVDNVQDGVDECDTYDVGRDTLQRLIDTCKEVLADNSKAEQLLPTENGFFFGSTEYDQWYYEDIKDTIAQLEKALASFPESGWYFQYHASW